MAKTVNIHGTEGCSLTEVLPELDALRAKHGAASPVGHRCSNIQQLARQPEPPLTLIQRQVKELEALLK